MSGATIRKKLDYTKQNVDKETRKREKVDKEIDVRGAKCRTKMKAERWNVGTREKKLVLDGRVLLKKTTTN